LRTVVINISEPYWYARNRMLNPRIKTNYAHESRGARIWEILRWRCPAKTEKYRPDFSSERALHINKTETVKTNNQREKAKKLVAGPWYQDGLADRVSVVIYILVQIFCGERVSRGLRDRSLRPYSRFSRPEPLLFFQVAPQLYSQGWVDPIPHPLLKKFGSAGNWTRTSDHRGGHPWTPQVKKLNTFPKDLWCHCMSSYGILQNTFPHLPTSISTPCHVRI
jgi:hypothetical protein